MVDLLSRILPLARARSSSSRKVLLLFLFLLLFLLYRIKIRMAIRETSEKTRDRYSDTYQSRINKWIRMGIRIDQTKVQKTRHAPMNIGTYQASAFGSSSD